MHLACHKPYTNAYETFQVCVAFLYMSNEHNDEQMFNMRLGVG